MVPEDNPPVVGAETWDGKDTSSISGAIIFGIVNHKANSGTARMEAATLERRAKRARSEADSLEKDAKKAKREAVAKIKAAKLKALAFNTKAVDAAVPSTRPSLPSAPPPTDYEIIRILASRPPYMLVVDLTAHFTGRLTTKQERKNFSNSMKRIGSFFFNQGNIKKKIIMYIQFLLKRYPIHHILFVF
jgi:hypothetical protein